MGEGIAAAAIVGSVVLVAGYGLVVTTLASRGMAAEGAPQAGMLPEGVGPYALLGGLALGALVVLALRAKPGLKRLAATLRAPSERVAWTAGLFLVGFGVFLVGELAGVATPKLTPLAGEGGDPIALVRPLTVGGSDGEFEGGPRLARIEYKERQVWVEALAPGVVLEGEALAPETRHPVITGSVLRAGEHRLRIDVPPLQRLLGGAVLGRLAGLLALLIGLTVLAPRLLAPLGVRRPTLTEVKRGTLAWLGTLPLYAAAVAIGSLLSNALGVPSASHELVLLIGREGFAALGLVFVLAAVLAPLKEELLLRGILLPALGNVWGPRGALLATSVLFGVIHLSLAALLPMFVLGLLFGSLRLTAPDDDPLTAAVSAHVLHNGTTLALVALGLLAKG